MIFSLPPMPEWISHVFSSIHSAGKSILLSVAKNVFQKNEVSSSSPPKIRGYSLIRQEKREERRRMFEVLQKASKNEYYSLPETLTEKALDRANEKSEIQRKSARGVSPEEYKNFCSTIEKLRKILEKEPSNYQRANREIILLIRKAVTSEAYQALCCDESFPAIRYLHRIVLASFVGVEALKSFSEIGASLEPKESEMTAEDFSEQVRLGREKGHSEQRFIKNDISPKYVAKFATSTLHALKSEKIIPWLGEYDPRVEGESFSGKLFEEEGLTALLTSSPTLGDKVSPEARALLQALENRRNMSGEDLNNDPYPYTHLSYTSYQRLDKRNEGPRARALMALNEEFPETFTGITLSLDSDFFRDGVSGKDEEEIRRQKIKNGETGLTDQYAKDMLNEILGHMSTNKTFLDGARYFFPTEDEVALKTLKKSLEEIILEAKEIVLALHDKETDPDKKRIENWEKKAAFRELVMLKISRRWQVSSAPKKGKGLTICACKESMDRGGQMNAALLWAQGNGSEASLKSVFALVQGRALISRNRLILPDRLEPFLALVKHVDQNKAHKFLEF